MTIYELMEEFNNKVEAANYHSFYGLPDDVLAVIRKYVPEPLQYAALEEILDAVEKRT